MDNIIKKDDIVKKVYQNHTKSGKPYEKIVLGDGTEFSSFDPELLGKIKVGCTVKAELEQSGKFLNLLAICVEPAPVQAMTVAPKPTTTPSPQALDKENRICRQNALTAATQIAINQAAATDDPEAVAEVAIELAGIMSCWTYGVLSGSDALSALNVCRQARMK